MFCFIKYDWFPFIDVELSVVADNRAEVNEAFGAEGIFQVAQDSFCDNVLHGETAD